MVSVTVSLDETTVQHGRRVAQQHGSSLEGEITTALRQPAVVT